jgi:hypothetical protein
VGIHHRMAELLGDPLDEQIRCRAAQHLSFLLDLVPPVMQRSDREQLDHPATADDPHGEVHFRVAQARQSVRPVSDQPHLTQPAQHR